MNDLSNFSQFHPSWEGRDFTKEEFTSLLDGLTKKKPHDALLTDGKTIRLAGVATQVWQKIKGWLGFDNQTDPIKVNYDLLKLLRYGETHHFFSDDFIKNLIQKLVNTLNEDLSHSYLKVINLIQFIFPLEDDRQAACLVDREIRIYYGEHQKELQESFWGNLFHKYIAPIHQTTANVYFNEANIALQEERFEDALKNINKALQIHPENDLWQLAKETILQEYAEKIAPPAFPIQDSSLEEQFSQDQEVINPDLPIESSSKPERNQEDLKEEEIPKEEIHLETTPKADPELDVTSELLDEFILDEIINEPTPEPVTSPILQAETMPVNDVANHDLQVAVASQDIQVVVFNEEENQIALANSYLEAKNFAEALPLYEMLKSQQKVYECLIGLAEQEENMSPETALACYKKALILQPNQPDARLQMEIARLCEVVDDIPEAIIIYQKLNLPEKIYQCCRFLAHKAHESKDYSKAIDYFEKALSYTQNFNSKQSAAIEILTLAHSLIQTKENSLAKKACLLALATLQDTTLISQKNLFEIYLFLAKTAHDSDYVMANSYLQKALQIRPQDVNVVLTMAELDRIHGNGEKAIINYEKAILLEPKEISHKQKIIASQFSTADKYYNKGVHDPQQIQDGIVDFVKDIKEADYGKEIIKALGAWRGEKSAENRELFNLGKNNKTIQQIAENGLRACKLLETAYDGQGYHMNPSAMPQKLSNNIQSLKKSISLMQEYYETLKKKLEELISEIQSSPFASKFSISDPLPSIDDLKNAELLETQTKNCLQFIEKAIQQQPSIASLALKQLIENLRRFTKPGGWINNAIYYYEKILKNEQGYGNHCNNLIDAYTKMGDYAKAIETYEELKIKFPQSPLFIDYKIYALLAENPNHQIKLNNHQLIDGILKAADQYSREEHHIDAFNSYLLALKKADDQKQKAGISLRLLDFGDKLLNTSHKDLAINAYKNALEYKNLLISKAQLSPDRYFATLLLLAEATKNQNKYNESVTYYEEASQLKPDHEFVNAELGELFLIQNNPEKAIRYLEKAYKVNSKNTNYPNQMATAENAIGDKSYAAGLIWNLRKSLQDLAKFVTTEAPYAKNITNALGSNLGWYSTQNKTLRNLGQSSETAKKIEEDSQLAIKLILSAYDGAANHNKSEDIPSDLTSRLESFQAQLNHAQSSMHNHSEWYQNNFLINSLENPIQKAILYFEKAAARFPDIYNDHYNRLIDAYLLKGEAEKAINLYKQLKAKFPTSSFYLNPLAYIQTFDGFFKREKYQEAHELINTGLSEFPNHPALNKRLSLLYFTLGQHAFQKNDLNLAVRLYTLATKCGVDAKAECYVNLAKIYMLANYDRKKIDYNIMGSNSSIYSSIGFPEYIKIDNDNKEYPSHFHAAVANLKKAADLSPNDAELRFQLARIVYQSYEEINFDVIPYINHAANLEPKNVSYAFANLMIQKKASPEIKKLLINKFKEAGGSLINVDDSIYWTMHNPQNFPLP